VGVNESTTRFAEEIGSHGAVWIHGESSRATPPDDVRAIRAPSGVHSFEPEEMTLACSAGTSLLEIDETLRARGQYVNLGQHRHGEGTVGGALAMGCNDHLRLGRGHVRESLLEVHLVDGSGHVVKGGGPTVKNVSGFDLCRLVVGAHGRLGALAEVILRTRPLPRASRWFRVDDVSTSRVGDLVALLYRPSSVLWDGDSASLCIEGHPQDVDDTVMRLRRRGFEAADADEPNLRTFAHRWSVAPARVIDHVASRSGRVVAEIGVGIVHSHEPPPVRSLEPSVAAIHRRLLASFDPEGRFVTASVDQTPVPHVDAL
jgi:FAD/FMN-containing dehydrogenase